VEVPASQTTSSGQLDVVGGRLAFDVTGSGPALVLVHAGIVDRRMWDHVVPALAERRTTIRYDTRGYGATRMLEPVPYSNRRDLVDLLDHLGIDRAAVCGVSRGGTIALDTALEFPARVAALVSVAGGISGFDGGVTDAEAPLVEAMERLEEARDWDHLVEAETAFWVDGVGQSPSRVPEVRRRALAMNREAYRDHADEPLDGAQPLDPPATGRLADVRVPTLAIVGDLDTSGTLASAHRIAAEVPHARLVVLPGVAHLPPMEVPERFVELVTGFLDEVGA
jgi:pimeloyl-ACP methyl ester carboxylesterase